MRKFYLVILVLFAAVALFPAQAMANAWWSNVDASGGLTPGWAWRNAAPPTAGFVVTPAPNSTLFVTTGSATWPATTIPGLNVNVSGAGAFTFTVPAVGMGNLTHNSSGAVTVTAANNIGAISVNGSGTLTLSGAASNIASITQTSGAIINNGVFTVTGAAGVTQTNGTINNNGTLTVAGADGVTQTNGTITNSGILSVAGVTSINNSFINNFTWTANGDINIGASGTLLNNNTPNGTIQGPGDINVSGVLNNSSSIVDLRNITVDFGGVLNNNGSADIDRETGLITVNGVLNNNGSSDIFGEGNIIVNVGGVLNNNGSAVIDRDIGLIAVSGELNNNSSILGEGDIIVDAGGELNNNVGAVINRDTGLIAVNDNGTLNNDGSISGNGAIFVNHDGELNNNASITGDGLPTDISVNITINNDSTLNNNASAAINRGVGVIIVNNNSTLNNDGSISGNGAIFVNHDGELNNNALITGDGLPAGFNVNITINNDGTLNNNVSATIDRGAGVITINDNGTLNNENDIDGTGRIYTHNQGVLNNSGDIGNPNVIAMDGNSMMHINDGGTVTINNIFVNSPGSSGADNLIFGTQGVNIERGTLFTTAPNAESFIGGSGLAIGIEPGDGSVILHNNSMYTTEEAIWNAGTQTIRVGNNSMAGNLSVGTAARVIARAIYLGNSGPGTLTIIDDGFMLEDADNPGRRVHISGGPSGTVVFEHGNNTGVVFRNPITGAVSVEQRSGRTVLLNPDNFPTTRHNFTGSLLVDGGVFAFADGSIPGDAVVNNWATLEWYGHNNDISDGLTVNAGFLDVAGNNVTFANVPDVTRVTILDTDGSGSLILTGGDGMTEITGRWMVESGATLTLARGDFYLPEGSALDISGELNIALGATLTNDGVITVNHGATIRGADRLYSNGFPNLRGSGVHNINPRPRRYSPLADTVGDGTTRDGGGSSGCNAGIFGLFALAGVALLAYKKK